jgi:hypothetical protein
MTSYMNNGSMKVRVILAIVLLTFGLFALINSPDGLSAAHKMLTSLVELWQDFISKDIVGIV